MVIDTDGSAFITKAEFDSLKNNFQAQIDNYNTSIDSKIDGAIAAYLSGIKMSTAEAISGGYPGFADLKFYNRLGIKSYTVNSGVGSAFSVNSNGQAANSKSIGSALGESLLVPNATDFTQYESFVFDFWGCDETMSRVCRDNETNTEHGFDWTGNVWDQMGLGFEFVIGDTTSDDTLPFYVMWSVLKFGSYGWRGPRHGWDSDTCSSSTPNSSGTLAVGSKGYTSLAGFAPEDAAVDTVSFIKSGANWRWLTSQGDFLRSSLWVQNPRDGYTNSNFWNLRGTTDTQTGTQLAKLVTGRMEFESNIPDGYALSLKGKLSNGKEFGILFPDSMLRLSGSSAGWYNTDPSADYRQDTSKTKVNSSARNIKTDTPMIWSWNDYQNVSDIMLSFDDAQNLYISKYGLKDGADWPLQIDEIVTGNVDAFDDKLTLMVPGALGYNIHTGGSKQSDVAWSTANFPYSASIKTGNEVTLKIPSYQKYDHLQNFINYNSTLLNDPLKINGGVRIGIINAEGTAEYKLKVIRSDGDVTNCKIYLKKSAFTDTVPAASDCISGSWDGGSGAICGVSPKADGTITLKFPAIKNDEIWIMVSPESKPTGAIAVTDTSYAYAKLVQCEGAVIKEN